MPKGNDGGRKAKRAGTRPTIIAPRGTIRPHKGFDEEAALAQAKILRTALQKPTNTNAIIGVLTKHTLEERKYVEDVYNAQHSPPLQEALRHEFCGHLRETLLALLQWPNQYLAGWTQRAMRGASTDQKTLFEVLCGREPADLQDCGADRPAYFAERLYRAMRGLGTDEGTLIRILVTRSEADLENIKEAYQRRYGKSLADAVEDDTSGYFWRCLKAIIKP
ncbi:annexin A13-like [Pollicipes pollicipes]|uniref:annexin A13-like n=1 Tax=Pollicipes pollicipes TaxID=41117 RepID=UPI00188507E6|nr:annexin A13-like [Pollicipes pollicipes]XP_037081330.1 annexin A13-like [Pollicipes pollicipes]